MLCLSIWVRLVVGVILLLSLTTRAAWAESPVSSSTPQVEQTNEQKIETLYLFVHCLGKWDRDDVRESFTEKWRKLLTTEGPKRQNAVCFLTSGPEASATVDLAKQMFGERCIVDPFDNSQATKALIADDLEASFNQRGNISEWTPYEMWTSTNARKWTEGLKIEMRKRNLGYEPSQFRIVAIGQQWGGCLAKYSAFMSRYLGLTKAAEIRPDLSPYAGFPLNATFRESRLLDRNVHLFLFETADGRPLAQFMDGLRGVFDEPHLATIPLDYTHVELLSTPPNATQTAQPVANPIVNGSLLIDVGDGCRPVITSVIGRNISYEDFRSALSKSTINQIARKHESRVRHVPQGCSDLLCPIHLRPPFPNATGDRATPAAGR